MTVTETLRMVMQGGLVVVVERRQQYYYYGRANHCSNAKISSLGILCGLIHLNDWVFVLEFAIAVVVPRRRKKTRRRKQQEQVVDLHEVALVLSISLGCVLF
jgi:hypothetical protein